ncbi:helix-turn-helix domain-containing protein [Thermopolyspora flexuosa]|uniref:DNA-binding XRE family transcriptional regulator n=1 Tax=Thermopolyspora flexuosa TaxID=103836 RepID=A0A543IPV8_9ACTN|nr:helix-turn-helix transcriptional regulator [Thermopolyspora flexuosa]TQM72616.1 DNA-binding XRE family transcriptional regulator [Thermopolyspora flexuosa]
MPSQGSIGDRVRGLRLSRRMSQAQLAGPDLSDSYVSLIESGKRTPTPVVARLLAERLGCTTEYLLHGIEPRQRIDTELGLRHAELELYHGDPAVAAERFGEIIKAADEDNVMLAAQARLGRARALERQGKVGRAVEAYERLRKEAAAHPERLADLPLAVALCRCYQRAGDLLRAKDLGAHALAQAEKLSLVHGDVAVELAAILAETETGLPYVERVLDAVGLPHDVVDRTNEIRALWDASVKAAEGDDSALAVILADDALAAGRPGRLAVRTSQVALQWARIVTARPTVNEEFERAAELAEQATDVLGVFPAERLEHARGLTVLAHVKLRAGDHAAAHELADRTLERLGDTQGVIAASAHLIYAHVALARSEGEVVPLLMKAQELLQGAQATSGPDREAARVWRELGDLWGRSGSRHEQFSAYRRALEAVGIRANMPGTTTPAVLTH